MQYADDLLLLFQPDLHNVAKIKALILSFELMSGLKINFLKREILCVGGDHELLTFYSELFSCHIGHFPMQYLGVLVSYSTLRALDWRFVEDKFLKCCESSIGNAASSGGRLTLLTLPLLV